MNTKVLRTVALLAPLVALILLAVAVATRYTAMKDQAVEHANAKQNLAFLEGMIREMQQEPALRKIPTVVKTEDEQSVFLDTLRQLAKANGVKLLKWSNRIVQPAQNPLEQKPKEGQPDPNAPVPIESNLEVSGEYGKVRAFCYALMRSPRLVNVRDFKWMRENEGQGRRVVMTLIRYVTMQPTDAAAATTSASIAPSGATRQGGQG